MPRNGSGGYTQPVPDFTPGTLIKSADVNSWLDDLGSEITNSIAKNGQTTPTANLPMGGFKHTDAADATVDGQYTTLGQVGLVKFADVAIPAVTAIDVTWTAGQYIAVRIHLLNFASDATNSTIEALRIRCRAGGSFVAGTSYTYWGTEQDAGRVTPIQAAGVTAGWIKGVGQLLPIDTNEAEIFVNPGATYDPTTIRSMATGIGYITGGTSVQSLMSCRMEAQASPVDGVRLFWNTGGNFSAYGRLVALGMRA